ncbi:MAG: MFS transporter, partial [Anaerolineae bacterium]|nr:MFS transporter [Anaerolineae bacterium]
EQLSRLLLAFFATSGVSVLLWQIAVRRFGTRSAVLVSMIMGGLCAIPLLFTNSLNGTSLVLALLGTAIGGLILGPDMLFAEVVDEDFVHTGQRREGMYRGILGFVFRFPPALAGLILNEGLALTGYDSDLSVAEQPDAVIDLIRAFAAVLPLVGLVLGILLLLVYPLHGAYLQEIQQRAAVLRQSVTGKKKQADDHPEHTPAST